MNEFILTIIVNILVGILSGIAASYIYDKIKRHSDSAKRKSVCEFELKFKFKK